MNYMSAQKDMVSLDMLSLDERLFVLKWASKITDDEIEKDFYCTRDEYIKMVIDLVIHWLR